MVSAVGSVGCASGGWEGAVALRLELIGLAAGAHPAAALQQTSAAGALAAPAVVFGVVDKMQAVASALLLCAATGYFLAAATRVPMMFGKPRACLLAMQAYDYLTGGLLLGLCYTLSVPQFCRQLQTKSLLSAVFERRIAHNEIMRLIGSE